MADDSSESFENVKTGGGASAFYRAQAMGALRILSQDNSVDHQQAQHIIAGLHRLSKMMQGAWKPSD